MLVAALARVLRRAPRRERAGRLVSVWLALSTPGPDPVSARGPWPVAVRPHRHCCRRRLCGGACPVVTGVSPLSEDERLFLPMPVSAPSGAQRLVQFPPFCNGRFSLY